MTACAWNRRRVLGAGAAALCAAPAGLVRAAAAEGFPSRPVRLVVPYSVGIGPDVVARALAAQLATRWPQPVLVENRPGASGIVALGELRRTAADGHALFLVDTATLAVNPLLHAQLPYDPQRDLAPLTLLFRATFGLWTGAATRWRHVGELLEAARRDAQAVRYASLGNGHASHVAVEVMNRAAGVRMLHVPFKETGALLAALVAGEVDFTAISLNTVAPLHQAGRLRPLAVAARERLAALPATPTLAEAGGPPLAMHPWAALAGVAGTPAPVLAQLQRDLQAALAAPGLRRQVEQAGFELTPSSPEAVRERAAEDSALYAPLVAEGRVARF